MPDTLPSLRVNSTEWTDAYAATGITVGTQLIVTVVTGSIISCTKATAPDESDGVISHKRGDQFLNKSGDSGLFIRATSDRALVNVSEY